jgi:hypothetical protein
MKVLKSGFLIACIIMFATKSNAQEITSFKGLGGEEFYVDKVKITGKQMDSLMAQSPITEMYWHKKKNQMLIGLIATTANIASSVWWIVNSSNHKDITGPIIATAGTAIMSAIFNLAGNKNKKKAILEYNDALNKKTTFKLVPASGANGIGLALKFR